MLIIIVISTINFCCAYLSLNHEVSLVPHVENKVEDVHFILVFDHLHHGLDGDQSASPTNTSTV
jgi:hypothetical protein